MHSTPGHRNSPKKRKHDDSIPSPSSSPRVRTIKIPKKHKHKDKGKGKEKASAETSDFRLVHASLRLSIPPIFAQDPRSGALELLDSMLMRYIPALEGVVLAHSNLTFVDNVANIIADCPFLIADVTFDATVWGPRIGMTLEGRINLCSPDHISLLIHETFNASIPRRHIPTDLWEFQYGPAANDPEFAPENDNVETDGHDYGHIEDAGKWVNTDTDEVLGGSSRRLKFTVVGLTLANDILSLLGSIQPDPFSPEHAQESSSPSRPSALASATDDEMLDDEGLILQEASILEDEQVLQYPEDAMDYQEPLPPSKDAVQPLESPMLEQATLKSSRKSTKKRKRQSEGESHKEKKKKKKKKENEP